MEKSIVNGVVVLTPSKGFRLTNGEFYLEIDEPVYLGSGDSENNWKEISEITCTIFDISSEFLRNPNGGHIEVTNCFVDELMCDIKKFAYNSNDYCGGSVTLNLKDCDARRNFKKVRITYSNPTDSTGIRLQFNQDQFVDTYFENTGSEFVTIEEDLPEGLEVSLFEIYVQGSRGHIEGEFFVKSIEVVE